MLYCPNCGAELKEGADVCVNCGKALAKEGKNKVVAGVLALFFGTLGVHNFYLGYNTRAIIQICITLLTCGVGALITAPWSLVEAIMLLCGSIKVDGKGNPLV